MGSESSLWREVSYGLSMRLWRISFNISLFSIGTCLSKCIVMKGATIRSHSWIQNSIIGWKSTVGRWVRCNVLAILQSEYFMKLFKINIVCYYTRKQYWKCVILLRNNVLLLNVQFNCENIAFYLDNCRTKQLEPF